MSDDPKWLAWRLAGVTATDVADAAQGSYGGMYGVVARKLGLVTVEQNAAMNRGHRWQPKIADAVHALTDLYVVGEETWCQHADEPWIRATVDGFLAEFGDATPDDLLGVVEVKTKGRGVRPNRERWADQVQWQLLATGLDRGLLAEATIDDLDDVCDGLHLTEIAADPMRQEHLRGVGRMILDHVQNGTLPEPNGSALDDVKAVNANADLEADECDLSDIEDDIRRLAQIKDATKAVDDERKELEARLRHRIGGAVHGFTPDYRVTISAPRQVLTDEADQWLAEEHPDLTRTVLDRPAFKKAHPDEYAAHTKPVGARVMTVKELHV